MLKYVALILLIVTFSCNSKEPGQRMPTVDSNVVGMPDSMPRRLHLDSLRKDTSVPIAMDSVVPAIMPKDTTRSNQE